MSLRETSYQVRPARASRVAVIATAVVGVTAMSGYLVLSNRNIRRELATLEENQAIANRTRDSMEWASVANVRQTETPGVTQRGTPRSSSATPTLPDGSGLEDGRTGVTSERERTDRRLPTLAEVRENVLMAFAKEASDQGWARDAARNLDALIRGTLPNGSRLLSIDCRTTMCLVEVRHASATIAHDWFPSGVRGWEGAVFVAGESEESSDFVQSLVPIRRDHVPPYYGESPGPR